MIMFVRHDITLKYLRTTELKFENWVRWDSVTEKEGYVCQYEWVRIYSYLTINIITFTFKSLIAQFLHNIYKLLWENFYFHYKNNLKYPLQQINICLVFIRYILFIITYLRPSYERVKRTVFAQESGVVSFPLFCWDQ